MSKIKTLAAMFAAVVCAGIFAKEIVLVDTVFNNEANANKWYMLGKPSPVLQQPSSYQKYLSLVKEDGITYLRTGGVFHIGAPLAQNVKIDDSVEKIEITVRLRNAKGANVMSIAMSDEPYYLYNPFRNGAKDSGFKVSGYQYGNTHNFLMYRIKGKETHARPSAAPVNLLDANMNYKWVTWKLTYNHAKKQLEFTRDGAKEPTFVQAGVDLSGITLKKVFLKCACDYQWAKVVLYTK